MEIGSWSASAARSRGNMDNLGNGFAACALCSWESREMRESAQSV
jgi:hypothetical protein